MADPPFQGPPPIPRASVVFQRELLHRVRCGQVLLKEQVAFFRRQFGEVGSLWKEDQSRVTFADFAISERIQAGLRRDFPKDDFCSEEADPEDEVKSLRARFAWVLDPVDGTNNYALGMPSCAISLALLYRGWPLYGFVYDHAGGEILHGGPEAGLFSGSKRFEVPDEPWQPGSIVGVQFPLPEALVTALSDLLRDYRVRCTGSAVLQATYAALGRIQGAVDFRVKVWDVAATFALCAAAGRDMEFLGPSPFPMREFHPRSAAVPFIAGSPAFRDWVRPLLATPSG